MERPALRLAPQGFPVVAGHANWTGESGSTPSSSFRARPIHGSGRIAFTQSAKDGNMAEILAGRVARDPTDRDHPAGRERDRGAENVSA